MKQPRLLHALLLALLMLLLAGCGTHDELLKSCPVYREIYDSQFRKEDAK